MLSPESETVRRNLGTAVRAIQTPEDLDWAGREFAHRMRELSLDTARACRQGDIVRILAGDFRERTAVVVDHCPSDETRLHLRIEGLDRDVELAGAYLERLATQGERRAA